MLHSSVAAWHRGVNGQPAGRCPGDGALPRSPVIGRSPTHVGDGGDEVASCRGGPVGRTRLSRPLLDHRPAYITATRSASVATTAKSWVTYRAATPWLWQRSRTVSSTWAWVLTSSPVVGSSSTITDGPAGEGHRQADALLLSTGELVRVAAQELRRRRQQHLAHDLGDAGPAGGVRAAEVVRLQHLEQLLLDAQCRVQRAAWVLGHVADELTTGAAQLGHRQPEHREPADLDSPGGDCCALAHVAEHGEADGRLARAGFADQVRAPRRRRWTATRRRRCRRRCRRRRSASRRCVTARRAHDRSFRASGDRCRPPLGRGRRRRARRRPSARRWRTSAAASPTVACSVQAGSR